MTRSPLRYCWAVSGPSRWLLALDVGLVALAGLSAFRTGADVDTFVVLILIVQTFAVSTSFRAAALCGHYDALLLHGCSRWRLAIAHWVASASPGIVTWVAMNLVLWADSGAWIAFEERHFVALALASTVPWAISFRLPRLTGGIVSLATVIALGASRWGLDLLRMALGRTADYGGSEVFASVVLFAVCPFLLPGSHSPGPGSDPTVLLIEMLIVVVTVAGPTWYVVWSDYPLTLSS